MPVVTYLAQRSLIGGHAQGSEQKIETEFQSFPRSGGKRGFKHESLNDNVESFMHALRHSYQILTDFQPVAKKEDWREFLDSVLNSETFEIDFTGTIAAPGTDIEMKLLSLKYEEVEVGSAYFTVMFNCREL